MKPSRILRILVGTAVILLVPLLTMFFTNGVRWGVFDFVIIGSLLVSAGLVYEFVTTKIDAKYRTVIAIVLIGLVMLVWAELAVGVFGSPIAGD